MSLKSFLNQKVQLKVRQLMFMAAGAASVGGIAIFAFFYSSISDFANDEPMRIPVTDADQWIRKHGGSPGGWLMGVKSFVIRKDSLDEYVHNVEEVPVPGAPAGEMQRVAYYHIFLARVKQPDHDKKTTLVISCTDRNGRHIYDDSRRVMEHIIPCPECIDPAPEPAQEINPDITN